MHRYSDLTILIISIIIGAGAGLLVSHQHHITNYWDTIGICALGVVVYTVTMRILTVIARRMERRAHPQQSEAEEAQSREMVGR